MLDLSRHNPLGRFSGLAENYAKYRPTYPAAALDHVIGRAALSLDSVIVDVGCGTGISSRWIAERGYRVLGIEPNEEMLREARNHPKHRSHVEYRNGSAEATGLGEDTVDLVTSAQAFHWFQPEASLREIGRILKPRGWVALIWNERDNSDAFTAAYDDVIHQFPESKIIRHPESDYGSALWQTELLENAERVEFANTQSMTADGLVGRACSVSYVPRDAEGMARMIDLLRALHAEYQENGVVTMRYQTVVSTARTREREPASGDGKGKSSCQGC